MVPESYNLAYAALDAVWEENPSESLSIFLSGMRVNPPDGIPMDPAFLTDWEELTERATSASLLDWIIAYLEHDASLYSEVPSDLQLSIDALRTDGSRERAIVNSVIAKAKFK
jgi:hypothetical protein